MFVRKSKKYQRDSCLKNIRLQVLKSVAELSKILKILNVNVKFFNLKSKLYFFTNLKFLLKKSCNIQYGWKFFRIHSMNKTTI